MEQLRLRGLCVKGRSSLIKGVGKVQWGKEGHVLLMGGERYDKGVS